jgi:ABC-type dipeptide/oligopeptide/nickel transport system permease subunit
VITFPAGLRRAHLASVALLATSLTVALACWAFTPGLRRLVDSLLMRSVEFLATIPALLCWLIVSAMLRATSETIPIPALLDAVGNHALLSPRDARRPWLIILVLAGPAG